MPQAPSNEPKKHTRGGPAMPGMNQNIFQNMSEACPNKNVLANIEQKIITTVVYAPPALNKICSIRIPILVPNFLGMAKRSFIIFNIHISKYKSITSQKLITFRLISIQLF